MRGLLPLALSALTLAACLWAGAEGTSAASAGGWGPPLAYLDREEVGLVGGPAAALVRRLYLGADGIWQRTEEVVGDRVTRLAEGRVARPSELAGWIARLPDPLQEAGRPPAGIAGPVPARAALVGWAGQGGRRGWRGPAGQLPQALAGISHHLDQLLGRQEGTQARPGVYLRAFPLTASERAGLASTTFHPFEPGQASKSPALARALRSPGRLVPVGSEANPFAPYHAGFVPTRSVLEVRVGQTPFQVRSLVLGP